MRIGDTVVAKATITDIDPEKGKIRLETVCMVGEKVVIDGEAQLLVSRRATTNANPAAVGANGLA